eukprot:CAMPEP_0194429040 /NCGR_PEP_ID=MMETSP0176-20130528/43656_1 /TAXON_ID=216777 /ORGANISM="Proboscia alata, Strain PI-D3" /LENGTH=375 /DNA_ID=CAMNT_0039241755 /DNA_START=38 /DNA_END=1165 /DNA_ORIENTATION=-
MTFSCSVIRGTDAIVQDEKCYLKFPNTAPLDHATTPYSLYKPILFNGIPLVDFQDFLHGSKEQKFEVAAKMGHACREVGFFYLVNHGIPQALVDGTFAAAKEFFSLPLEAKEKTSYVDGGVRGYFGMRSEDLNQFDKTKKSRGDMKEGFDVGLEASRLKSSNDYVGNKLSPTFHSRNQWPTELPRLKIIMEKYIDSLRALSELLVEAFAISLGVKKATFPINTPCINLRMNHYPARTTGQNGLNEKRTDEMGCGAHTDYGLFTILSQDSVGGLQVLNSSGDWVNATPIENSFVINIGDMMHRWTNGRYASTLHRVVDLRKGKKDRISIPFFFNPNCDALVECITNKEEDALFEAETAENILTERYEMAFKKKEKS